MWARSGPTLCCCLGYECCDEFVVVLHMRRCAAANAHLCGILQHTHAEPASLHLHLHRGSAGHSGSGSLVPAEHYCFMLKIQLKQPSKATECLLSETAKLKTKINSVPNVFIYFKCVISIFVLKSRWTCGNNYGKRGVFLHQFVVWVAPRVVNTLKTDCGLKP